MRSPSTAPTRSSSQARASCAPVASGCCSPTPSAAAGWSAAAAWRWSRRSCARARSSPPTPARCSASRAPSAAARPSCSCAAASPPSWRRTLTRPTGRTRSRSPPTRSSGSPVAAISAAASWPTRRRGCSPKAWRRTGARPERAARRLPSGRAVSFALVRVLGINAASHDPAAALVVDGRIVAAAEEERFSRRKHGKACVPFSTWELPEQAIAWCLERGGIAADDLDAIGYSYDPALAPDDGDLGLKDPWDHLRVDYARRAPQFLASELPGLDPDQ